MSKFIKDITKKIEIHELEVKKLNHLLFLKEQYSDLNEESDRWNRTYYTSSFINEIASDVEFRHSCGCCNDASLLAYFYTVIDGIRIYSNPFCIAIGESNETGYGEIPYSNWKSSLEKYNINSDLFSKVQSYLADNPPVDYDDDDIDY